jgi:transcription antitermination factor NusG
MAARQEGTKVEAANKTNSESEQSQHWYAVNTRSRHEKAIAARLRAQATDVFLPLHRSRHTWNNGVHAEVDLPFFPCYLFVKLGSQDRLRLLQTPGVIGLAATSARPTAIPNEEIEMLRTITAQLTTEPHPYLRCGERVRIVAGSLSGIEGILTRRKQAYRVVLSIEAIMRSVAVEVSEFDIEPARSTQ